MDILFLIGRIVVGYYFLYNARNHLFNTAGVAGYGEMRGLKNARFWVPVTGVVLALSGLSVALGFVPHIGALLLIIFLVSAAFLVHHPWTDTDMMTKIGEATNFWKNLGLAGALLFAAAIAAPWPISVEEATGPVLTLF